MDKKRVCLFFCERGEKEQVYNNIKEQVLCNKKEKRRAKKKEKFNDDLLNPYHACH